MNLLGEREPPAQTDPRSPILGPQPCRQSASESPTFAEPLGNPQKPFPAGVPVDLCPRPGAEARALHTVPRSGTATKAAQAHSAGTGRVVPGQCQILPGSFRLEMGRLSCSREISLCFWETHAPFLVMSIRGPWDTKSC